MRAPLRDIKSSSKLNRQPKIKSAKAAKNNYSMNIAAASVLAVALRCCRKMWVFCLALRSSDCCAGGCYSNLRCIDLDANWTDPIVSDFTHTMRTVGLMVAQGFGAQAF